MKIPDVAINAPKITDDSVASAQLATAFAKISDILRDIYGKIHTLPIVTSAPASTELDITGDGKSGIISDIKVLYNATQTNRKIYYKNSAGTLRYLESD